MAYQEKLIISNLPFPVDVFISHNRKKHIQVPAHYHRSIEILFMLKGKAEQKINNAFLPLKKDDLLIINSEQVHGTRCSKDSETEIMVIQFLPEVVNYNTLNIFESKYIIPFLTYKSQHFLINIKNNKELRNLLLKIYQEFIAKEKGFELYIKGAFLQIISFLIRYELVKTHNNTKDKTLTRLNPLFKYIEKNYSNNIDLAKAANFVNMNYYYLSHLFKEATGKSFTEYLNFVRINEAKKLLISKDLNITDIAYMVGYKNVSSFNRRFKSITGLTPSTFQNAKTAKI